jgi:3-oxoacid CoA-transferase subunit A
MAVDKVVPNFDQAVQDISDGASVAVSGAQGPAGIPRNLLLALVKKGTKNLTAIGFHQGRYQADGFGYPKSYFDIGILIEHKQVRKLICGLAFLPGKLGVVQEQYEAGELDIEHLGHGNFTVRLVAAAAGYGGIYTPTGVGTILEQDFEKRTLNGRDYLLMPPLEPDFALIWAYKADRYGNLVYVGTSRQLNIIMAKAAKVTIAEVEEVAEPGELDPEHVDVPGIYIDRIVKIPPELKEPEVI